MMKNICQLVLLFTNLRGRNGFDRVKKKKSASRLDTTLTVQKQ